MNIHVSHHTQEYIPNPGDRIHLTLTPKMGLARHGNHLLVRFPNGKSSRILGFYDTDDLTVVSGGREFSPDSLSEVAEIPDGTRIHNYEVMDALDGIDHLNGLDYSSSHDHQSFGQIRADNEPVRTKAYTPPAVEPEPAVPEPEPEPEPEPDYFVRITPDDPVPVDPLVPNSPAAGSTLPPGVFVSEAAVFESDLAKGPVAKSGSLTIEAPAGLFSIIMGNTVIWENGVLSELSDRTFETDEGKLVITSFDGEKLTYTFTLDRNSLEHKNQGQDSISHSFEITATDATGISAKGYIAARIVDDIPTALPDEASLTENPESYLQPDVFAKVSGSVIDNDDAGQDGFTDVAFSLVSSPEGKYGNLVLNTDGSYTYTLNRTLPKDDSDPVEVFTYRVYDADGDYAETTLTIRLESNAPDYYVRLTPDGTDPELLVDEADLAKGPVEKSGYLEIEAPAGLFSIAVGNTVIWENGVLADLSARTFETDEGKLVITSFDGEKLTYTFTLDSNSLEHGAQGRDSISHSFEITATDTTGINATASVAARVIDDIPTALPDEAGLKENPLSYTRPDVFAKISGSVAENDDPGQDGYADLRFALVSPAKGKYGTLTLNPDGSYTYALDRTLAEAGENPVETFTYRVYDGDDDYAETTLTIRLEPDEPSGVTITPDVPTPIDPDVPNRVFRGDGELPPDALVSELLVDEADLAKGPVVKSGYLEIDAPAGLSIIALGGRIIWQDGELKGEYYRKVGTDEGAFLITGFDGEKLTYTYTLDRVSYEHEAQGRDSVSRSLEITAIDVNGQGATGYIVARIVDDMPTAMPDEVTIAENVLSHLTHADYASVSGCVADNDSFGQDGWTYGSFSLLSSPEGRYGTLRFHDDTGEYTYTLNRIIPDDDADPVDVFTYRVMDSEGDWVESTLTIHIEKAARPVPSGHIDLTLHDVEASLDEYVYESVNGQNDFFPARIVSSEGITVEGGERHEWTLDDSGITLTGISESGHEIRIQLYDYLYDGTVIWAKMSRAAGHDADSDTVTVSGVRVLYLEDGKLLEKTVSLTIIDDVPIAGDFEKTLKTGESVSIVDAYSFGYDRDENERRLFVNGKEIRPGDTVETEHGSLVFDTYGIISGTVEYHAKPVHLTGPYSAKDVFTLKVIDSEGDVAESTLTFNIHNDIRIDQEVSCSVSEKTFGQEGYVPYDLPPGYEIVSFTEGQYGHFRQEGRHLYYIQDKAFSHDGQEIAQGADALTVTVQDGLGNTMDIVVRVDITDAQPSLDEPADIELDAGSTAYFEWNPDYGVDDGDGKSLVITDAAGNETVLEIGMETVIQGEFGKLCLTPGGECRYAADADLYEDGEEKFILTITDADGSAETGDLVIRVSPDTVPPVELSLDESSLVHGSAIPNTVSDEFTINPKDGNTLDFGEFGKAEIPADGSEFTHTLTQDGIAFAKFTGHVEGGKLLYELTLTAGFTNDGDSPAFSITLGRQSAIVSIKDYGIDASGYSADGSEEFRMSEPDGFSEYTAPYAYRSESRFILAIEHSDRLKSISITDNNGQTHALLPDAVLSLEERNLSFGSEESDQMPFTSSLSVSMTRTSPLGAVDALSFRIETGLESEFRHFGTAMDWMEYQEGYSYSVSRMFRLDMEDMDGSVSSKHVLLTDFSGRHIDILDGPAPYLMGQDAGWLLESGDWGEKGFSIGNADLLESLSLRFPNETLEIPLDGTRSSFSVADHDFGAYWDAEGSRLVLVQESGEVPEFGFDLVLNGGTLYEIGAESGSITLLSIAGHAVSGEFEGDANVRIPELAESLLDVYHDEDGGPVDFIGDSPTYPDDPAPVGPTFLELFTADAQFDDISLEAAKLEVENA